MDIVSPFKEGIDAIKEAGGEGFRLCYQCGLCDTLCPWNRVRTYGICKSTPSSFRFGFALRVGTVFSTVPAEWK